MAAPTTQNATRRLVCARCGALFECGLAGDCWCTAEAYRLPTPALPAEDCVCPACLRTAAAAATTN